MDEQLQGGVEHLFVGTSLPFLISPGLHDFEAINEAMASGAWGPRMARRAESLRRTVDLEHWAAFQDGFAQVFEMVASVARGERAGPPGPSRSCPATCTTRSSPRSTRRRRGPGQPGGPGGVLADPQPHAARHTHHDGADGPRLVRPMRFLAGHSSKVPDPAYPWRVTHGPWYENCLATLHVRGRGLGSWEAGVSGDRHDQPEIRRVARVTVS